MDQERRDFGKGVGAAAVVAAGAGPAAAQPKAYPKAYPKATFYVQKREYDFWTKHPVAKRKIFAGSADPLAYVYVGDFMVNAELAAQGFAKVSTVPPSVKHQGRF